MAKLLIGMFLFFAVAFAVMFYQKTHSIDDSRAIKNYIDSRGKAPIPNSWRDKIGEGI